MTLKVNSALAQNVFKLLLILDKHAKAVCYRHRSVNSNSRCSLLRHFLKPLDEINGPGGGIVGGQFAALC